MTEKTKTVVVVEDSPPTLRMLTIALESFGYHVKAFENAALALENIPHDAAPDLIITDLYMPNMNGLDFIKEVKKIEILKDVSILVLTAEKTKEFKHQARAIGVQGWLVKPITRARLLDVIRQFL